MQAAQGAALIADGLAGARHALVDALAFGGVWVPCSSHLYVIMPAAARARLGWPEMGLGFF